MLWISNLLYSIITIDDSVAILGFTTCGENYIQGQCMMIEGKLHDVLTAMAKVPIFG